MNIARLLNEIGQLKAQIQEREEQLTKTRIVMQRTQEELHLADQHCLQMKLEWEHMHDKHCLAEVKNDEARAYLESERRRQGQVHAMHVKLLSLRILEESLQQVVSSARWRAFLLIKAKADVVHSKAKSAKQIKKLFNASDKSTQKRHLQRWFTVACSPVQQCALSKSVPVFFNKRQMLLHFYFKWRSLFLKKTHGEITLHVKCSELFAKAYRNYL